MDQSFRDTICTYPRQHESGPEHSTLYVCVCVQHLFLAAKQLRKANVSLIMHVRISARKRVKDEFRKIPCMWHTKICRHIPILVINSDKKTKVIYVKTCVR